MFWQYRTINVLIIIHTSLNLLIFFLSKTCMYCILWQAGIKSKKHMLFLRFCVINVPLIPLGCAVLLLRSILFSCRTEKKIFLKLFQLKKRNNNFLLGWRSARLFIDLWSFWKERLKKQLLQKVCYWSCKDFCSLNLGFFFWKGNEFCFWIPLIGNSCYVNKVKKMMVYCSPEIIQCWVINTNSFISRSSE